MDIKGKYVMAALACAVVVLLIVIAFLLGQKSGSSNVSTTSAPESTPQTSSAAENASPGGQDALETEEDGEAMPSSVQTASDDASSDVEPQTDAENTDAPRSLDISMTAGSLTFVSGSAFNVDYDSSVINVSVSGETMTIKNDHSHPSASERKKMDVTVTVPENYSFGSVDIEFGAGKMIVRSLSVESLGMELGAGSATFDNVFVSGSADIREGAGELVVSSGRINDLTLQCGAGATRVACELTGTSSVTAAVGAVDIDLKGEESDYSVSFQIGLGACYYNGAKLSRSGTYGDGKNSVRISGGLGVMRVNVG